MYISQTAEYALRAMVRLSLEPEDRLIRGKDLAEMTGIPSDYLSKVLRDLVEARLLLSRRGHHGGFQLAQQPGAIRFYDIFMAVGLTPDIRRCAFGWEKCNTEHPCPLHGSWSRMNSAFWEWSLETTLASCGENYTLNDYLLRADIEQGLPK